MSRSSIDRTATEVPFFVDALWSGLVPPFSAFFDVVLSHYQIHMLHLDPQSVTLLAVFSFVCEAMVGIVPSVALLRHFLPLHLTNPRQCSGCVSFQAMPVMAGQKTESEKFAGADRTYSIEALMREHANAAKESLNVAELRVGSAGVAGSIAAIR